MKKQYLHLSAYSCDKCRGPVVSASLAVRENVISKETDKHQVGATCLSCGHQQPPVGETAGVRHFMPVEWNPAAPVDARNATSTMVAALNRADLH